MITIWFSFLFTRIALVGCHVSFAAQALRTRHWRGPAVHFPDLLAPARPSRPERLDVADSYRVQQGTF